MTKSLAAEAASCRVHEVDEVDSLREFLFNLEGDDVSRFIGWIRYEVKINPQLVKSLKAFRAECERRSA